MTIRAILRNGHVQLLDPLPPDWAEGQELVVEEPQDAVEEAGVRQWAAELDTATATIPLEEHQRFLAAINEIEQESKDAVRREWGLP